MIISKAWQAQSKIADNLADGSKLGCKAEFVEGLHGIGSERNAGSHLRERRAALVYIRVYASPA